jgi:hypothetical protein
MSPVSISHLKYFDNLGAPAKSVLSLLQAVHMVAVAPRRHVVAEIKPTSFADQAPERVSELMLAHISAHPI